MHEGEDKRTVDPSISRQSSFVDSDLRSLRSDSGLEDMNRVDSTVGKYLVNHYPSISRQSSFVDSDLRSLRSDNGLEDMNRVDSTVGECLVNERKTFFFSNQSKNHENL